VNCKFDRLRRDPGRELPAIRLSSIDLVGVAALSSLREWLQKLENLRPEGARTQNFSLRAAAPRLCTAHVRAAATMSR
jgi:hypothetical protein